MIAGMQPRKTFESMFRYPLRSIAPAPIRTNNRFLPVPNFNSWQKRQLIRNSFRQGGGGTELVQGSRTACQESFGRVEEAIRRF